MDVPKIVVGAAESGSFQTDFLHTPNILGEKLVYSCFVGKQNKRFIQWRILVV